MYNVTQGKEPGYYAIIPATIRYDSKLRFAERLLYGEITALIRKTRILFCYKSIFCKSL